MASDTLKNKVRFSSTLPPEVDKMLKDYSKLRRLLWNTFLKEVKSKFPPLRFLLYLLHSRHGLSLNHIFHFWCSVLKHFVNLVKNDI